MKRQFPIQRKSFWLIAGLVLFFLLIVIRTATKKSIDKVNTALSVSGDAIIDTTAKTLTAHLQKAVREGGIEHGLQYCNLNAIELTKEISDAYDVQITRKAIKYRNPNNKADSVDLQIMAEFSDRMINGQPLEPRLVQLAAQTFYYKPIILQEFCKNCHGSRVFMGEDTWQTISMLYPEDQAIDFRTGDLRGVWRVEY